MDYYTGRCKHGVYVGGCGIDYMCGACELGDDEDEQRDYAEEKFNAQLLREE